MAKRFLTPEQAEFLLPDEESINTFYNLPVTLVGADWSREEVLAKIHDPDVLIEMTGEQARNMGHGMCVHPSAERYFQSQILFIETNEDKIKRFEEEHHEKVYSDCCAGYYDPMHDRM